MTVKKRLLKIGAALLGSAIVVFLLLMASSVLGDPVSKYIAQKEIERYVEETYPEQQLSVSEVRYNFKLGGYYAEAASDTSIDTRFSVYWRFGEGCSDGYAAVTEGANTFSRMEAEYTKRLYACIQDIPQANELSRAYLTENEWDKLPPIPLDTPFSLDLPLEYTAFLQFYEEEDEITLARAAQLTEQAYERINRKGYVFSSYSISLQLEHSRAGDCYIMVDGVTAQQIESGNLENLLEEAWDSPEHNKNGVWVQIYYPDENESR